jgi:hypothetical protein
VAQRLIEVETLGREEFLELMGEPPEKSDDKPLEPKKSARLDGIGNEQTDTDMPPAPLGAAPSPA